MPRNRPQGEFPTYVIKRSWPAVRPDGRHALLLETQVGIIAIEIDLAVVQAMRAALLEAENLMKPPTGRA